MMSRRGSDESVSSIATARSGVSAISNGTSGTSQSDRFVKAPAYDPSSLPALPQKTTKEEKGATYRKYNSASSSKPGLRARMSSPIIQQKQNGTTPPPPARTNTRTAPSLP